MSDGYERNGHPRPGFRLHKLEVYNWGTFDSAHDRTRGRVYTLRPEGQTTLLVGQNGTGKSTLVDALLTLLVRPAVRNYNVAAGAGKRERDERTYIKGAYDRRSREEDNRADVQFLRPDGGHYSVLLACFRNEATRRAFTLAQVLYLDAEGQPKKLYCFAPEERSITADFGALKGTEKLKQQLERRGFRTTATYSESHEWFRKATGVKPKAMDMFNQTVAVKDIHRLNDFIRDHMLEARPWNDKVESLLRHFTELSEAHQSLVRVRKQSELLEPIAETGAEYRAQAGRLERVERLLAAADPFFRQKTVDLLTPACERRGRELQAVCEANERLSQEIAVVQDECRRLQNEIDQAGGERLREIPRLIQIRQTEAATRRAEYRRFEELLRTAGIDEPVRTAQSLAVVRERLPSVQTELEQAIAAADAQRFELGVRRGETIRTLREDEHELEALQHRRSNLPEALAEVRRELCEELRLRERDLPFAAELISVRPDERAWEASIEMALRPFALSLLVPQQQYALVSAYVDRTRLNDTRGRGQRLVYLKVGSRAPVASGPNLHPQSLVRKLAFRDGHPLLPWVRSELAERCDFRCCETVEEFQQTHGPALTRERHLSRGVRHEKDDRQRAADPRHFVLGWDNREKRRRLAEHVQDLREAAARLDEQIARLDATLADARARHTAVCHALQVTDFTAIDYASPESEIETLRLEQQALEAGNKTVQVLKRRLVEQQARATALEAERVRLIGDEREHQNWIRDAQQLIASAQRELDRLHAAGTFERHAECFDELEACFADVPLGSDDLLQREAAFTRTLAADRERLQKELNPLHEALTTAMGRFLSKFPDERADLEPSVRYLDSFLGLLEHIRGEDLPRHERRFKDRLNEKVTHELGLLNAAFDTERTEIEDRIEMLNESLKQLEYRPGTHMRLEARPVRDAEIADFRRALAECLSGTFEGTLEADEARYLQIEKLITRLREEERWRNKVTDVRRWYDFAARELDDATGAERGYYEDSTGQSGGEKAKLAFTILVAAIAYQYDIDPAQPVDDRFHFVVIDEMFSKVDDQYAEYALELFEKFGLQLLIVAPLDAKARVTEPYVGCYLHVIKDPQTSHSEALSMTAREFEEHCAAGAEAAVAARVTAAPVTPGRRRPR